MTQQQYMLTDTPSVSMDPPRKGMHKALCVELVDCGKQRNPFEADENSPKAYRHRLYYNFVLEELDDEGRAKEVRYYFSPTLGNDSKRSGLYQFEAEWMGSVVQPFDVTSPVGRTCQLLVTLKERKDGDGVKPVIKTAMDEPGLLSAPGYTSRARTDEGEVSVALVTEATNAEADDIPF